MRKIRLAAGVLAIALLAGCGSNGDGPQSQGNEDDIVYQVLGVPGDTPIMTVDGVEVDAERYLFWLVNSIEAQKYYVGLETEEDWIQNYGGATIRDIIKSDALEALKIYQIVENKATELGVTLTQEEEEEFTAQLQELVEESGGDEAFRGRLDEICISREGFTALNRVQYLHQNLQKKLAEAGELTVTQGDLDQFVEENGIYGAKHILISTRRINEDNTGYEEYSDEEKEAALQKAQDLRKQLADAGDSQELFDQLMKEYSEDGRDSETGELYAPEGYPYVTSGRMVSEFEDGAMALEVGEISEPIQSEFGYHIILRIPLDEEQLREDCNEDYMMNLITRQWLDQAQVTTTAMYDELDPKVFYEKLQEVIEARAAESAPPAESEQPEESPAE